ncbi:MAG TPA: ribonuclease D [Lentisphaeria bacterium]|nr:ribonuclease D [Lentisphaeria bacterium]
MSPLIADTRALTTICEEAAKQDLVAIDTEFVWTNTYHPRLGLIQLAWDEQHSHLLDVLAINDPTPLQILLDNATVTKVFHEAASDLPILRRWCGALTAPLVDTRIAAGFCGLTATMSLNRLLTSELGITLPKTETRTDWLQRPLSDAQLQYAASDVALLPKLYRTLEHKIDQLGNLPWFKEEMASYSHNGYYGETKPDECWRRVSGMGSLSGIDLAVLKSLAAWREQTAQELDKARPRVMKDEQLVVAARLHPKTLADLKKIPDYWPKLIEKFGEGVLAAVQRGLAMPQQAWPVLPGMRLPSAVIKQRSNRILQVVQKRANERQIDPQLVAARKDAEALVFAAQAGKWPVHHQLLQGWRRELTGDVIENLVTGNFND